MSSGEIQIDSRRTSSGRGPTLPILRQVTTHAVLVGVERAQRLAERLADAIAAVGPHRDVGADLALARIEADGVIGRGEDHALDACLARRLEEVVAADDVGIQDRVPRASLRDRMAAEMDDAVGALHRRRDLVGLGEVGRDEGFARLQILGLHAIAQHQPGIELGEQGRVMVPMPPEAPVNTMRRDLSRASGMFSSLCGPRL